MTEPQIPQTTPETTPPPRKKRRWLHHSLWTGGSGTLLLIVLLVAFFFWASSAAFENALRHRLIAALEDATGGRVEIAAFHWNLLSLRAEADNLTIHGLESSTEAPYVHVDRLRAQIAILNLLTAPFSPKIILREAEITRPEFHLIVYPDGTTNQPHPRHPLQNQKPAIDTLFDAQIGKLAIEQGTLHIAKTTVPLDLKAQNVNLQMNWIPANGQNADSYKIQLGIANLAFVQGPFAKTAPETRIDATLDLFHDSAQLESLRLRSRIDGQAQTLNLSGKLLSFAHPAWQTQADGQLDLRILAPYIAFPNIHSGIVTLHATVSGSGAEFQSSGNLTSNAIHYQDPVVDAQTAAFSCHFRSTPKTLVVNDIRIHIAQGGDLDGEFQFDNWLDFTPTPAIQRQLLRAHQTWPHPTGQIRANLHNVTLDTILLMLAAPGYRHLGLDTVINGPAHADWTGLAYDLQIGGQLSLTPSAAPPTGEAPVQGFIDATYHADQGAIKVDTMDLKTPHSSLKGTGLLGVFPIDRSSEMALDLVSTDLTEFDAVLKTLGLKQGNRTGAAALPVSVQGQAEFHGELNSSWQTPRVEGHVTAKNIGIELPQPASSQPASAANPQFLHWDSVDAAGLYTPSSIVIRQSTLRRGPATLTLQGQINSTNPKYKIGDTEDEFDNQSPLTVKATAQNFPLDQLLPIAGVTALIKGSLSAEIALQGQIASLTGSGAVDIDKATAYGESLDHLHATGSVGGQQIKIATLTAAEAGGTLTGSGSYDIAHSAFQIDARASAIDLASIQHLKQTGLPIAGKLAFTANGSGTLSDPHLQTHATFSSMRIAGEPVSDLALTATAAQHAVTYDLSSHQPAGEFSAHGDTKLDLTAQNPDYYTQASLQFSKFDIGALLKLLHVTGITGQSALEGKANISGPLTHPEKIRGEANLNQLNLDVESVHLASKGPVHATLVEGITRLDPLEITGEDTDLKINGSLAIQGKQELDVQANGSVNMRLAATLDPDLIASGITKFQMEAHGPLSDPTLQGKVEFQNVALALGDFPNGLSQIKGTLEFIQNRLEVRSLTAMSGGGQLSVGGYLGFQHGLYADLSATGKSIRIRYPQGISSLADASLKLQGPQNNLQLSGTVQVTRFAINSDLDIASLTSSTGVQPIVPPDAPSNHLHLDIHLTSAPQLNFQNAYAKLAGDVDLHLRGTLASPSLLGRISLTEGSTSIGGTKYELERGDINFTNPVRIQPNIDIDATARVEDYDITLGLHGSSDKPRLTYRSEPPLPEADIIALLALGRTQNEAAEYGQQQQQGGDNPNTDALLGGALNATVTNRVQRLFGTGAVKIDPNFIGALGNSTARVTVVEQIGNNVTFTYASNVNTTTQQLIQAEIAINRHLSLLVTQDEAGIFSVVLKNRRRFK
jgi:translocation and assembly module TamB